LRSFRVIETADDDDQKMSAFANASTCRVSIISQHLVDNLDCTLFKVIDKVPRTRQYRTKQAQRTLSNALSNTDRPNDMENTRSWELAV